MNGIAYDKLGAPITVGSIIAYGHALGRCAGVRIGKVLAVKQIQLEDWQHSRNDYKSKVEWRITVLGVDDDWNHREVELCKKKGTLMFPNRIIVLDPQRVPAKIRDLFKEE